MFNNKKSGGKSGFGGRNSGGSKPGARRPSGGRPSGGRTGAYDFGAQKEMHKAICSDCGAQCRVPFKPTGAKPVKCSACFEADGNGEKGYKGTSRFNRTQNPDHAAVPRIGGGGAGNVGREIAMLNEKMDRIIKALHI